jgi:hypothetical protein
MWMSAEKNESSALPKAWIVPIRLGVYSVLAGCSAYVYFNVRDLGLTHYLILMAVVAVSAMALLDCRMSEEFWRKQASKSDKED